MTTPDRYAVLGNPVAHSRSPWIHAQFARLTGEAIAYGRVECPLDGFEAGVRAFCAGGARGCNVTVPFKHQAWGLAAHRSGRADLAGAANVLRFDEQGWFADNTDGVGLVRDIELHAGLSLAGRSVLLIGAGGAAAGVLGPLLQAGAGRVVVVNRGPDKARALVASHAALATACGAALEQRPLQDPGASYEVVINATASSLQGAPPPVGTTAFSFGGLAVDLMYGAAAAPFLRLAQDAGARARDGLGMLVEQAAEAFHVWRGVRPPTPTVLAALRSMVDNGQ